MTSQPFFAMSRHVTSQKMAAKDTNVEGNRTKKYPAKTSLISVHLGVLFA